MGTDYFSILIAGTGTTLLEGLLAGHRSIGTDLNPLARLIAKVKTTLVDVEQIDREIENFIAFGISESTSSDNRIEPPSIPNVDYWFSPTVQRELLMIREFVDRIADTRVADFFRVGYSLTIRGRCPGQRIRNSNSCECLRLGWWTITRMCFPRWSMY